MPSYYGEVTEISRIKFTVEADSEEEAKELLFNSYVTDAMLVSCDDEKVIGEVQEAETYFVDKKVQGNVSQSGVADFWIQEDK